MRENGTALLAQKPRSPGVTQRQPVRQPFRQPKPQRQPVVPTQRRPQENVESVTELERATPKAPFVALILALVVAGMVTLVLLNTAINENAFRLHDLAVDKKKLDMREQQLKRDVAELESAGSVDAAARRLGLVPAGAPAFIELPSGRVLGVPKPARKQ